MLFISSLKKILVKIIITMCPLFVLLVVEIIRLILNHMKVELRHMNRLNKTESAIFVSLMCSLLSEDLHSELITLCPVLEDGKRIAKFHYTKGSIKLSLLF